MADNETPRRSKSEIRREIGDAFLERRKARGLTLEKVMQSLKIRVPYLEALEKGEWDDLPGEVYARGFLKRYAQFLGLDGDRMLASYLTASGVGPRQEDSAGPEPVEVAQRTPVIWIWIGVAVLVVIAIFNLARYEQARLTRPRVETPPAPVPAPAGETAVPPPPVPVPVTTPTPAEPERESHLLQIFSPYPLWIRIEAENRTFEGFIPQGSSWQWRGEGRFSVRLGHTREVNLRFDGAAIALGENQRRLSLPDEN